MTPPREPSIFELVRDPALRTAAFVTAACGLAAFGALFLFRGPTAAGVTAAFAVVSLVFRWVWPVGFYLLAVAYFLFLPDGTPIDLPSPSAYAVRNGPFAIADLLLVPVVLAYVAAQYRFLGLTKQALPFEPESYFSRKPSAVLRPAVLVTDREWKYLAVTLVAAVLAGQCVWYLLTRLQWEFLRELPIRLLPLVGMESDGVTVLPALNRLLLLVLAGFAVAGTAGLLFWYWGVLQLTPEEAAAATTDAAWHDSRRELQAQEKRRAAARAEADRRGLTTDRPEDIP